jgi:RNA polymerase sigma-70 factor (ECF subfamily)
MDQPSRQTRFLDLLEQNRGIVHRIAYAYSREPTEREDLAQEIVLQLWRSFDRYDFRRRFSTWMYRVALNVAISHQRSEERRTRVVVGADSSLLETIPDRSRSPDSADDLRLLRDVVARLNALDRALIVLYLEGSTHAEIAEVLGISETNAGTRLGRIRQRLRQELSGTV